jgi:hypothetical protein
MRIAMVVTTGVDAVTAASAFASASPAAGSGGLPCKPKIGTLGGKPSMALCGPATVSVRIDGKSYSFKNGFCQASAMQFEVSLGTVTGDSTHNHGLPHFSMFGTRTSDLTAAYGGRSLVGGMTLVTVKGSGTNAGTFTSRLGTPKVSGSWNCHGVIVKT